MRVGILLLALNILFTPIFGQKIDVSFRTLDINHGLYFVPNTMKPFSGNAGEKFPEGKKKMIIPIKDGKINGTIKGWAKNGQKIFEGKYTNGVSNGTEIQWYASGQKKLEVQYTNGEAHGVCTEWFKTKAKKSEGYFNHGKEEGDHFWWYSNGAKDQVIPYKNGKANGTVKHWTQKGQLKLQSNYKDGLQHGSSTEWHTNGQKILESHYDMGKEDGTFLSWSKSGLLLGKQVFAQGVLKEDYNYRSGNIRVKGGYTQVYNTPDSFFQVDISGDKVIRMNSSDIIYVVDTKYLQLLNSNLKNYFGESYATAEEEEAILNDFYEKEISYIREKTAFDIDVKKELLTTANGKKYIYWHFISPSSQDEKQTDKTVQEEHYVSMICNQEILNLYSLVTKKDTPAENVALLKRIAENIVIKSERIDLNSVLKQANQ